MKKLKNIKNINELKADHYGPDGDMTFDPSEYEKTATFYLHRGRDGFVIEILLEDRDKLEEIFKRNKIEHTIFTGDDLPF
mgnify:CR=1 FL=1